MRSSSDRRWGKAGFGNLHCEEAMNSGLSEPYEAIQHNSGFTKYSNSGLTGQKYRAKDRAKYR